MRMKLLAACLFLLSGCSDDYEDQVGRLERLLDDKPIGSSRDYWLVKGNLGLTDAVALFFGYLDDGTTCLEFAELYMQRYPGDSYTCLAAN